MADGSGRCTAQRPDGTFCDADAMPAAPFPICPMHLRRIYEFARDLANDWDVTRAFGFLIEQEERAMRARRAAEIDAVYGPQAVAQPRDPRVYYLILDGLVKIGCTMNLPKRLLSYPPHVQLLGSERGYHDLEHERHKQFAHLNAARREWFHAKPELLDFITALPAM